MNKTITIKEQITSLLGISEEAYAACVERFGYDFAWYYTQHHEWSTKYLTQTASYWNWWKRLQAVRDELFIAEMSGYRGTDSEQLLMDLWIDHNEPQSVESKPTKRILEDSYQLMVDAVDKERNGQLKND